MLHRCKASGAGLWLLKLCANSRLEDITTILLLQVFRNKEFMAIIHRGGGLPSKRNSLFMGQNVEVGESNLGALILYIEADLT